MILTLKIFKKKLGWKHLELCPQMVFVNSLNCWEGKLDGCLRWRAFRASWRSSAGWQRDHNGQMDDKWTSHYSLINQFCHTWWGSCAIQGPASQKASGLPEIPCQTCWYLRIRGLNLEHLSKENYWLWGILMQFIQLLLPVCVSGFVGSRYECASTPGCSPVPCR